MKKNTSKSVAAPAVASVQPVTLAAINAGPVGETLAQMLVRLEREGKENAEKIRVAQEALIAENTAKRTKFLADLGVLLGGVVAADQVAGIVSTVEAKVYPSATVSMRGRTLNAETKTSIENALKANTPLGEISKMYNVSASYVSKLKKGLGLTKARKVAA